MSPAKKLNVVLAVCQNRMDGLLEKNRQACVDVVEVIKGKGKDAAAIIMEPPKDQSETHA